jgi:hypothetical protein
MELRLEIRYFHPMKRAGHFLVSKFRGYRSKETLKALVFSVLLGSFLLSSLSCQQNPSDSQESESAVISKAHRMMDESNFDGAVQLLDSQAHRWSSSERFLITWASAYALRAGLRVENYWDLVVGFDAFAPQRASSLAEAPLISQDKIPKELGEEERKILSRLNDSWKDFRELQRQANKIPLLSKSSKGDLTRARDILSSTQSRGARLYRALVIVTHLKVDLVQADEWFQSAQRISNPLCSAELQYLSFWLNESLFWVHEGLGDMSRAYPENESQYQRIRDDLQKGRAVLSFLSPRTWRGQWCR